MGKLIVHRRGYHRRDGTYVRSTTFPIRDRGHPGRTPESQRWFPRYDEEHRLIDSYGHEWKADETEEDRHHVLSELSKTKGWTPIEKRLVALRNVTTSKKLKHAASRDIAWIQNKRAKGY
jgi:hypothetical protein